MIANAINHRDILAHRPSLRPWDSETSTHGMSDRCNADTSTYLRYSAMNRERYKDSVLVFYDPFQKIRYHDYRQRQIDSIGKKLLFA